MRVWEGRLTFVKCFDASYMHYTSLNLHNDSTHHLSHDHLPVAIAGRDRKSGDLKIFLILRDRIGQGQKMNNCFSIKKKNRSVW